VEEFMATEPHVAKNGLMPGEKLFIARHAT
jgi:hypothetical protein